MGEKLKQVIREKSVVIPVNREFPILIPVNRARHPPPPLSTLIYLAQSFALHSYTMHELRNQHVPTG